MFADAYRRGAEKWWLVFILLLPPIGALCYFILEKVRDYGFSATLTVHQKQAGPSVHELKELVAESPSVANRVAYGDALRQASQFADAVPEYELVLKRDGKCKEAMHGLALCLMELGDHTRAADHLSKLMDLDPRYRDFCAAVDYAEALWFDGRRELSLEVLEDLATTSSRIEHSVTWANYLALADNTARAREVLQTALKEYRESPSFVRRRDHLPARDAERLLGQLG